ncbi:unnamed protein product, partial [Ixodes hexagonus]
GNTSRRRQLQRWKEEREFRRVLLEGQGKRPPFRPPSRNPSPVPALVGRSAVPGQSVGNKTTATSTPYPSLQARGSASVSATTGSKLFAVQAHVKVPVRITRSATVRRGLDLGSATKEAVSKPATVEKAAAPQPPAAHKMAAPQKPRRLAFKENTSFAPAGFQFKWLPAPRKVAALQPLNGPRQGHPSSSSSSSSKAAVRPLLSGKLCVNNPNTKGGHNLRPKVPVGGSMDFCLF